MENDQIALLLAGNNESNNNDCTTTTTIRTEKGTIMGPNTAPTDDDGKDLELDKTNNKSREDVENSGEEDEDKDGSLELNSEIKNTKFSRDQNN